MQNQAYSQQERPRAAPIPVRSIKICIGTGREDVFDKVAALISPRLDPKPPHWEPGGNHGPTRSQIRNPDSKKEPEQ